MPAAGQPTSESTVVRVIAGLGAILLLMAAWTITMRSEASDAPAALTPTTIGSTIPPDDVEEESGFEEAPRVEAVEPEPVSVTEGELAGLQFTDVTADAGLLGLQSKNIDSFEDLQTAGVAVGDFDNDGDLDVVLTRVGLPTRLFANDGNGHFADVTEASGLVPDKAAPGHAAAVFADVNGDGWLDLLLTGAGGGTHNLFINDGTGRFMDHTEASGVAGPPVTGLFGSATYGAAFNDWDGDGDLDLVIVQWYTPAAQRIFEMEAAAGNSRAPCTFGADNFEPDTLGDEKPIGDGSGMPIPEHRSRMLLNDGTGTFTDVTAGSGIQFDRIVAFQPRFVDYDQDGWDDLFLTGDACTSRVYRNDEGRGFIDVTSDLGVGTDENGMGSIVADIDGDGHLDWFITGISYETADGSCPANSPVVGCTGNRLYLGDGHGRFTDSTDEHGVRDAVWGWGAISADLNNNTHNDLLVVNGIRRPGFDPGGPTFSDGLFDRSDRDPNRLWLGREQMPWPDVATTVGIDDATNAKGVVAFDADGDGDLDLLIAVSEGDPILYRNDTPTGPGHGSLTLRLRQPGRPNTYAIGARVRATRTDGRDWIGTVQAGGSFQSGDPTDFHIGLGNGSVSSVQVWWPGETEPAILEDIGTSPLLQIDRDR